MKRFSKKRNSIIECLKCTDTHPNAEWVYNKLKSEYPDLSLATVYRNLNMLKNEGIISSVGVVFNKERFDGRTVPHTHAVCGKCGKIFDIDNIVFPNEILKDVEKLADFRIEYSKLQLIGICSDCDINEKI